MNVEDLIFNLMQCHLQFRELFSSCFFNALLVSCINVDIKFIYLEIHNFRPSVLESVVNCEYRIQLKELIESMTVVYV